MTISAVLDAAGRLAGVLDKQTDLNKLVRGWLEKQLKSKTATLSSLRLLAKSSGSQVFQTLLEQTSDTAARTLAKNLDPHNAAGIDIGPSNFQRGAIDLDEIERSLAGAEARNAGLRLEAHECCLRLVGDLLRGEFGDHR